MSDTMPLRVAGLSIPKSGTHLLAGIFKSLGYRVIAHPKFRGRQMLSDLQLPSDQPCYVYGHFRYSDDNDRQLRNAGFERIVLIRDPRDVCLSMADFIKAGRHPALAAAHPTLSSLPLRTLQIMAIKGFTMPNYNSPPIGRICEGWLPWQENGALLLRYEQVEEAVKTGEGLNDVAGLGLDQGNFLAAARKRFRPKKDDSSSYRWECEFDDELLDVWQNHARGVAGLLGYREL